MGEYTRIDGERVAVGTAARFKRLAAAFQAETACSLHVSSGTRTLEEQAHLYDGWINRRPGFNLAAPPGYSNHEESGPIGPRALDVYDSGRDAGVTSVGTHRSNVLKRLAPQYGFNMAGLGFNPREAWHIEDNTADPFKIGDSGSAGGSTGGAYTGAAVAGVHGPNPFGIPYTGGLQKIARLNGYNGALDQHWGDGVTSGSMHGFVNFLRHNWGYSGNTVLGPQMWRAIQRWLKARWGYTGDIDGIPGPLTRTALLRADTANWAEL